MRRDGSVEGRLRIRHSTAVSNRCPQADPSSTDPFRCLPRPGRPDEAGCMSERLDVTGVLRRARRRADLSQRQLAELVGVSASMIGRAETGGRVSLDLLERSLAGAGLRLLVVDATGTPVTGMRSDGVRDGAHRRLPAHLDPVEHWGVGLVYRHDRPYPRLVGSASFSRRREHRSATRPDDHPSRQDLMPVRRPPRPVYGRARRPPGRSRGPGRITRRASGGSPAATAPAQSRRNRSRPAHQPQRSPLPRTAAARSPAAGTR